MRLIDNGAYYTVQVSENDVARFKAQWPCSGLPDRRIAFEYQRSNGDLVDMRPDTSAFDGPALLALSQDAQEWAERQLGVR